VKPGDVVAGRYELEELVGAGGMSSVFRARDRVLERDVAVKVLHAGLAADSDIVARFGREARLVAGLAHQNIVTVIDRGEHEGGPFIVFEYIAGENLKQLVARRGPLPPARAVELAIEVAHGLSFAHRQGFVHRDVKPQNVLLNGRGEAKVTDFGIARPLAVSAGETQTGTVLGSCDYISPEQAQGRRVGEQSDVYSLGIVLYELLTGEVPFGGENFVAVAMQHINAQPAPLRSKRPELPARLEAAVAKALAKDPADRFETMSAFADELELCLAELRAGGTDAATAVLSASSRPARTPRRRRRWPLYVLAGALLGAIVTGVAAIVALRTAPGAGGGAPAPVRLLAVSSYDPFGNNHIENPRLVPYATDGNRATFWSTEDYYDHTLGKPGVGIILDAGAPVQVRALTIVSSTPGYRAIIRAASRKFGPFTDDSRSQLGGADTTFTLDGVRARYYLIWITSLGGKESVQINEVTASG
jgi:serine/threonine-protein kinase